MSDILYLGLGYNYTGNKMKGWVHICQVKKNALQVCGLTAAAVHWDTLNPLPFCTNVCFVPSFPFSVYPAEEDNDLGVCDGSVYWLGYQRLQVPWVFLTSFYV